MLLCGVKTEWKDLSWKTTLACHFYIVSWFGAAGLLRWDSLEIMLSLATQESVEFKHCLAIRSQTKKHCLFADLQYRLPENNESRIRCLAGPSLFNPWQFRRIVNHLISFTSTLFPPYIQQYLLWLRGRLLSGKNISYFYFQIEIILTSEDRLKGLSFLNTFVLIKKSKRYFKKIEF